MDYRKVQEALWSPGHAEPLLDLLLEQYRQDAHESGLDQPEKDYLIGWERLSAVLTDEQMETLKALDSKCRDEAGIALKIALDRGLYAGFQHFFQPDQEPLSFETLVLNRLLTVPEVMRFPQYDYARMQANELETELSEQLDLFSREHLTSITYAWEERCFGMMRHGYALGYRMAVDIIRDVSPDQEAKMIVPRWRTASETGIADQWE